MHTCVGKGGDWKEEGRSTQCPCGAESGALPAALFSLFSVSAKRELLPRSGYS